MSIDGDGVPDALAGLRSGSATYYTDGRMWAGRRLENGRIAALALSDAPVRDARRDLRRQMLVAGGAAVPLTGLLGFAVATGLSRRLRRAAAAVAAGDTARLSVGGRDEVAALAGAVDEMAATLDDRLRAEQAFSADVAHELRTPVAGLVSAAEPAAAG
ncbi:HAMP domain-containing protein [Nocardioides sp. W3-2-3]|nr:HAMP domain-containing protein [Nocardioides convexus]